MKFKLIALFFTFIMTLPAMAIDTATSELFDTLDQHFKTIAPQTTKPGTQTTPEDDMDLLEEKLSQALDVFAKKIKRQFLKEVDEFFAQLK